MDEVRKPFGLGQVWAIWKRRWWLALLVFLLPFSGAVSLVMFLPNIYRSSAVVLVERQQVPEEFVKPTVTGGIDNRLNTISQEILSRARLEELINRFGLYSELRDRVPVTALVERMRRDIQLEFRGVETRVRGSSTIAFTIGYDGNDPRRVAQVANTLASSYVEENTRVRERQASGTAQFLESQLQQVRQRLDAQEERVSEFKKRYIGELPEQMAANLSTLQQFSAQLRLNSDTQVRAMERREGLTRQVAQADQLTSTLRALTPDPVRGLDDTETRIARLRQEVAELRTRFSERYPDVIQKKAELASLEGKPTGSQTGRPAPTDGKPAAKDEPTSSDPYVARLRTALREVEGEIKVLKEEERHLRAAVATYQARVENTPRREQQFQELSRDYESTKELYRTLLKRYDEAQLAENLEQRQKGEQFRILEPAVPSKAPAAPNRLKLMLMSLVLSVGLAAGAVVLAERLDTSFHTVDDLRGVIPVPVLAAIPRIVTKTDIARRRWRIGLAAVSAMLALALIVGSAYFAARGNEQLVRMVMSGRS